MSNLAQAVAAPAPPPPQNGPIVIDASDTEDDSTEWESGSEASYEEEDEDTDMIADEAFWEEDAAADRWLAKFQGGLPLLYPRLYVVKSKDEPNLPRETNPSVLLRLPPEIRNRIYEHCFHMDEEEKTTKHPTENYAPFHDREGRELQRIVLSSENEVLKFWLSTSILQTSRQLRSEAMHVFFSSRVFSVEWLPSLPRFVEFLGKEGCAMVRYVDVWDTLDAQNENSDGYRCCMASLLQLTGLQHLRIVLRLWPGSSCFDPRERGPQGFLKGGAIPKMRLDDKDVDWPDYDLLQKLAAHKFTLALEEGASSTCLEFDRKVGAYGELANLIQANAGRLRSTTTSATATSQSLPQSHDEFEMVERRRRDSALGGRNDVSIEISESTWQETDMLANKSIPLYNFLRLFFHNISSGSGIANSNFVTLPTALRSKGAVIQDCPFCYLGQQHCGYHSMPDQPPFKLLPSNDEDTPDDVGTLQKRFENLSYVDLRQICRDVTRRMANHQVVSGGNILPWQEDPAVFEKIYAIHNYRGWPELPNAERFDRLDAAAEAGWIGKRIDKEETPPWDMLYREVHSDFSWRL